MATNGTYYSQTSGLTISTDSKKRVIVSTGGTTTFTGDTNGSTVIEAVGTNGELFSVDDDLSGDILVVTNPTGGTIFAVNYTEPVRISGVTSGTSTNYLVIESNGVIKYREIAAVGESGISGIEGSFISSGLSGISGISGISGLSGLSGGSGISGVAGSNGVSSSVFYYSANTLSTSGNPGTGYTLWNNVTQTASTQINIHHLTDNLTNNLYTDIDVFLATIAPGQKLIIQDQQVSGDYQIWNVTGTTTNVNPNTSTSYWTVPVSISSSAGVGSTNFANNEDIFIAIQGGTSGISGQSGVSGNVGGGISWVNALTAQTMVANTGYVTTASTLTTLTLPTTISLGQTLEVVGYGTGLWRLNENSNQFIKFGNTGTTTTSGILSATSAGDSVRMTCVSANTAFVITSSIGNVFFS
jgi:hypothetical protein